MECHTSGCPTELMYGFCLEFYFLAMFLIFCFGVSYNCNLSLNKIALQCILNKRLHKRNNMPLSLAMIVFGQLTISIYFIVRILIRRQCEFWTRVMNEQKRYVIMEGR